MKTNRNVQELTGVVDVLLQTAFGCGLRWKDEGQYNLYRLQRELQVSSISKGT